MSKTAAPVALTGATGFVGGWILKALLADGAQVRALSRRPAAPTAHANLGIVRGALGDPAAIEALCAGAGALVHCAGLVKARNRAEFLRINTHAARTVAAAAAKAGVRRIVLISSLSARAPALSPYAESKAAGEAAVRDAASGADFAIVRPPAVYGPGDLETLKLVKAARSGWMPAPGGAKARLSLIYGPDLGRFVSTLTLSSSQHDGAIFEPDDGLAGGYSWRAVADALAAALDRKVRTVPVSRGALTAIAGVSSGVTRLAGGVPIFTPGKAREMTCTDLVCHGAAYTLENRVRFEDGVRATLAWARAENLV